jgi:hypothetical protein
VPRLVQAREEWLGEPHDVAERPDLAAVGVAGELQPDAEADRVEERPRLVREQHQLLCGVASG